ALHQEVSLAGSVWSPQETKSGVTLFRILNRTIGRENAIALLVLAYFGFASAQDDPSSKQTVSPAIGLQIRQRASAFSSRDQFGHVVSNETLRGTNGTILLFFRSADW
ncbi:MAG: hypothetical protein WAK24_20435, partial [Candidatus Acidiferrales bacterium]